MTTTKAPRRKSGTRPKFTHKTLPVYQRVKDRLDAAAEAQGLTPCRMTSLLLEHALDQLEAGRLQLVEPEPEGTPSPAKA